MQEQPNHGPDHLKRANSGAEKELKEEQTQNSGAKSFSLLDQWNCHGFSLPTFDLQELIDTPTIPARLDYLQQIQYLEDVLGDWRTVREVILTGLEYATSPLPTHDNSLDESVSPPSVALSYLKLHRKWFHEARSSIEYLGVQYDLCSNLSNCITNLVQSSEYNISWLSHLLHNWHDMFLDMMQRDHYVPDEMKTIESTFLMILESSTMHSNSDGASCSAASLLAIIDPQAKCFGSWIHHVPLQSVESMLQEHSQLLPVLWNRCQTMETSSSSSSSSFPSGESLSLVTSSNNASDPNDKVMTNSLRWYSMSVLSYLLIQLRVALFPWRLLFAKESSNHKVSPIIRYDVFEFYLKTVMSLENTEDPWQQEICYNTIETILCGSDAATLQQMSSRLARYKESACPNPTVWKRLQDIVTEVQRNN